MRKLTKNNIYFYGKSFVFFAIAIFVVDLCFSMLSVYASMLIFPAVLPSVMLLTSQKETIDGTNADVKTVNESADSNYLLYLQLLLLGLVIDCLVAIVDYFVKNINAFELFGSIVLAIAISLLCGCIYLPIKSFCKAEKVFLWTIIAYLILAVGLGIIMYLIHLLINIKSNIFPIILVFLAIAIVCYGVSWLVTRNKLKIKS